ncbi:MAG: NAD(P)/FAD-dependent oxidoreductase [Cyanobacteria bacterium SZAS LIN-5]|nr:NAD(P)/FAD-dependent oxidoreductase [Cyanobacteria bacterium SZAS LIN-5]RTL34885.1 MAG: NAD(P)/FAD-dependent oxidoreductase [Candidatus Melainabacteria bacterium]
MEKPAGSQQTAVIIGAGPAGLTAAFELLKHTKIKPIVLERTDYLGGIARTVNYKGNRIDIGGHRFFSKSDRVMQWWLDVMPLEALEEKSQVITYQQKTTSVEGQISAPDPKKEDRVMLLRNRKSRIYFMRKFFDYPISLTPATVKNMGLFKTAKVGLSYMKASLFPIKPEKTLDEFLTNRFGKELYLTFFKSYTEKVWGVPCSQITSAWGAQRIKGLSLWRAVRHFFKSSLSAVDIGQKETETSLIERFLYPKLGPGQMWEYVGKHVTESGGEIHNDCNVVKINVTENRVKSVEIEDAKTGERRTYEGDYFFSTMAIKDLVQCLEPKPGPEVTQISDGLLYRDFFTVGLLVNKLKISEQTTNGTKLVSDNWIYIQEPDVKLGRLQIFNNWSPYMIVDQSKVWLGLEYFCNETDDIWSWDDQKLIDFAGKELEHIGIIDASDVLDATVIRMPKTYPGYFGTYEKFDVLQRFIDRFENLFLVGRNGMHKYNNQDHSMLTAMTAVENIINGVKTKDNIWSINTELDYHEEKTTNKS